jgi:hypothetical protein
MDSYMTAEQMLLKEKEELLQRMRGQVMPNQQRGQTPLYGIRSSILAQIREEIGSMSPEEQEGLFKLQEIQDVNNSYNAGLNQFILNKFTDEYASSEQGQMYASEMLALIRKSKPTVKQMVEEEKAEVEDFKNYKNNYSNMTYEEYKKMKQGKENK